MRVLAAARKDDLPMIEFMIHSSELVAGGSPYAKDEAALDKLYKNLESMLLLFKKEQLGASTALEFAESFGK
jgi:hypothetical protein